MSVFLPFPGPTTHPVRVGHETGIVFHLPLLSDVLPKENKELFTKAAACKHPVGTFSDNSYERAKFYYSFKQFITDMSMVEEIIVLSVIY